MRSKLEQLETYLNILVNYYYVESTSDYGDQELPSEVTIYRDASYIPDKILELGDNAVTDLPDNKLATLKLIIDEDGNLVYIADTYEDNCLDYTLDMDVIEHVRDAADR